MYTTPYCGVVPDDSESCPTTAATPTLIFFAFGALTHAGSFLHYRSFTTSAVKASPFTNA
jgi:hypothetical protein